MNYFKKKIIKFYGKIDKIDYLNSDNILIPDAPLLIKKENYTDVYELILYDWWYLFYHLYPRLTDKYSFIGPKLNIKISNILTNIISLIQKIWIKYNNLEYFDERTYDISESGRITK